jgi:uncharacterized protein (TIGR03067 family)
MKALLVSMFCVCTAVLVSVAECGDGKGPKIEGKWKLTGGVSKGKKAPQEFLDKITIMPVFKDGKYSITMSAEGKSMVAESGTYKVDATKMPTTIDFTIEAGMDKGKTQLGILKLEGDTATLVVSSPGSTDRPKTFEPGADVDVHYLKRSK